MNFIKKMFVKKEKEVISLPERTVRDLLRENLKTVPVDVFYIDDPIMKLGPEERKGYLKYFDDIIKDGRVAERIKYYINKQANLTLQSSGKNTPVFDVSGSMNINGMASIKDDHVKLSGMFNKENGQPDTPYKKMGI